MKINKYLFWGCYALFLAIFSLSIDVYLQFIGLKHSISETDMLFARTAICVLINMSIFASPQFRHLCAGSEKSMSKWCTKKLWYLAALPLIFVYSALSTSMNMGGMIEAQAKKIESARSLMSAQIDLANDARRAANDTSKTAKAQRRIIHLSKSSDTQAVVTGQLEIAAQQLTQAQEQQNVATHIKATETARIPLAVINALFSPDEKIEAETFMYWFLVMTSFCLLLIGTMFSELGSTMFAKSVGHARTSAGLKDISKLEKQGQLTDEDSITAINKKLECGASWSDIDITRSWIADAHFRVFGRARKGETLDKFIAPTRKKLKPWYKRVV